MVLRQYDVGKRVEVPGIGSGWYYWTNVYYNDTADFINAAQARLAVLVLDGQLRTEDAKATGIRIHQPPGRHNVVENTVFPGTSGGSVPSEGSYTVINVARWHFRSSTGRYSYRLNRMPLRPSDLDGENLSASGLFWQTAQLNTYLSQGWCRNSYGELLTSGEVVPRLVKWQMRHGTERRARNPLA